MRKIFDSFDSNEDFALYAQEHYLPLLEKLSNPPFEWTAEDVNLLGFLYQDLSDLCNKFLENY